MKISIRVKRILKKACVTTPGAAALACRLSRKQPRIFMYHRFGPAGEQDPNKLDAGVFDWQLGQISKRFQVVCLKDYLLWRRDRAELPENLAILTVDDGYRDFYEFAFPRLKAHGLPATFFPVVNFVDRQDWLWPDRLRYLLGNTAHKSGVFSFADREFRLQLDDPEGREAAWRALCRYAIDSPNRRREELLARLENELEVAVPRCVPPEWGPVSWEQLRELQANGIEIGSHTMNHPILSRIEPEQLTEEVVQSKRVLEERLGTPILSFCYPNSGLADINPAVIAAVRQAGYLGAAFGPELEPFDPYRVGRVGASTDHVEFLWKLYGMEARMKKLRQGQRQLQTEEGRPWPTCS